MNPRVAPAEGDEALDADAAPTLPVTRNRWAWPSAAVGAGALGLLVFSGLSHSRAVARALTAPEAGAMADQPEAPPPPNLPTDKEGGQSEGPAAPALRGNAPPPPPSVPADLALQAAAPADPSAARLKAPSLVVDLSTVDEDAAAANAGRAMAAGKALGGGTTPPAALPQDRQAVNERFAAAVEGETVESVRATPLRTPGEVILQGTVIPAVLETALNTDIPGYLRALVAQDVKSFDGAQVLIPRGSRLIGQYRSAIARGQSRAFVVWSRLIRPDGASIMLASPGGDAMGAAGLTGRVDNHFLREFGGAILLSVISAGSSALAGNAANTVVIGGGSSLADSPAAGLLNKETDIPPTVKVPQGAPMTIFVAKDLDFGDVQRGQ